MLKNSIFASAMAVLLATSLSLPSEAGKASKGKNKQQQKQQQQQQQELQSQQGTYDESSGSGSANGSAAGGSSISMFKAGNTTLPAGTYAMTNVSTGAAFVVIVDDSGDMRAQDARAMNLVDDKNSARTAKNSRKNSGGSTGSNGNSSDYDSAGNNYGSSNNYSSSNSNSGSNTDNYRTGSSAGNLGPNGLLPPQQTPSSAVLPSPNSNSHPLLQGASPGSVYQPPQQSGVGGILPNLFTSQNPLAPQNPLMPGQTAPAGIQGKIQAELQRQLNKQLMKYGGSGNLEQQVRKMINKF